MRPVDVKSNTYIDSSKEVNYKDPKFKIYPNFSEKAFVITKINIYFISDLKGKKVVGTFTLV